MSIEYDGSCFCGWQSQGSDIIFFEGLKNNQSKIPQSSRCCGVPSVQGFIEFSIQCVTHETVTVEGAGRTDAGVHARGQCAHFDLFQAMDPDRLQAGMNYYLQNWGISILKIEVVSPQFHARFSAISRVYQYRIINRRAPLSVDRFRAWHVSAPLVFLDMVDAAKQLVGPHNFNAFRSAHCQSKNPNKTLNALSLKISEDQIIATIQARSFLHNQVRITIGTLVWIGKGKMKPEIIAALLKNQDRTQAGPTAPPQGLYLVSVHY